MGDLEPAIRGGRSDGITVDPQHLVFTLRRGSYKIHFVLIGNECDTLSSVKRRRASGYLQCKLIGAEWRTDVLLAGHVVMVS